VAVLGLSAVGVAAAAWVGLTLPGVRADLLAVRTAVSELREDLAEGRAADARAVSARAATRAQEARDTTRGPAWRLLDGLPLLGPPLRQLQGTASAVETVATDVLRPLVDVPVDIRLARGRVDARPLAAAVPALTRAESALADARGRLTATPESGVEVLDDAQRRLVDELAGLGRTLTDLGVAGRVVPQLLGSERPRRYFLAVQNPAEPRATGGLIGSWAVLRADGGRVEVERTGVDQDLEDLDAPALDLGTEYERRYGDLASTSTWRSANVSPDAPTVGRLLAAMWQRSTGERLDGVVLVDPVALQSLLSATGPVTLSDGTRLSGSDAARVLLVDLYRRYPREQDDRRSALLQEAVRRTVAALERPGLDGRRVAAAVGRAAASGHVQVWAADVGLQGALVRSRAGGALLSSGPYLEVVTQDVGGSKLGTYLHRSVRYEARPTGEAVDLGLGPEVEEEAVVTVRLRNTAPRSGLPDYVTLRPDTPGAPKGQSRTWLSVYLGRRATLLDATLDGQPVSTESTTERGLAVFATTLTLDAGQERVLVLRVRQPGTPEQPLRWRQQPLLRPDDLEVRRAGAFRPVERAYGDAPARLP
jgi:hypothetical protein